jgi:hypothetical protein
MDRVTDLTTIVQREVAEYNHARDYKAKGFYLEDVQQQAYAIVIVPDPDHPLVKKPGIIIMARVVNDKIIIDEDLTDRPLYEALVEAGIPREQIVLAYAGESLPSQSENK